eukprot:2179388-Amphidinium_carterae.1
MAGKRMKRLRWGRGCASTRVRRAGAVAAAHHGVAHYGLGELGMPLAQLKRQAGVVCRALIRMPKKANPELVLLLHHELNAASVVNAVHGRVF